MRTDLFARRHIGPRVNQIKTMLDKIEVKNIEQLIYETIPDDIRLTEELCLEEALSESEFLEHIQKLGDLNDLYQTYIGLGYHHSFMPSVIKRNILENPGWYTAYTPYQAEIAQGRLEALLNFQTLICDLTAMELANASLLDESTAAAEAMTMFFGLRNRKQKKEEINKFFVSQEVLPQTIAVLQTKAKSVGIELVIGDHQTIDLDNSFFACLLQYPGKNGQIFDYASFVNQAKEKEIKVAVAADILSLILLEAPGTIGVDAVVGTTQRFGIPLGYGGPHAAFFATQEKYKRNLPGRIIGLTKDKDGNPALRMALQTREQHIKRDRATSNICTAQVLLAVMAGMYAVYHGPKGLAYIASQIHAKAVTLSEALEALGYSQINSHYFDTLKIRAKASEIKKLAIAKKINFLYLSEVEIGISINETTSLKNLNSIVEIFAQAANKPMQPIEILHSKTAILESTQRKTSFLTDTVFNSYHSETELMRYIKKLERKDLALNHSMISLGSCTMKLNAATEMLPLSWASWANIHPFVPVEQAKGYQIVLKELEKQLSLITGFDATSLQPNSGAQGEYTGLMVIKLFHESNGEQHRNICLIPASAHGTNPASAVLAGMKVVVIQTDDHGNIDVEDLEQKAHLYQDNLSALMVTYPSTHGVFESSIKKITKIIHNAGGQVYMDGANMNAQVGFTNPATIGADVCHLNLHKTFAIPHGGGGPGVGPVCVAKHLTPFLPSNPIIKTEGDKAIAAISATPWGSALVCLISYAYIKMLGAKGLKDATVMAILNANYMSYRLENEGGFKILYKGERGRAAHEMIVDCREFKEKGVEVVDIAKRLIDYGFHAPTVSFPVAGTMMIEPTESESIEEMDRFCDAMLAIKKEIENTTTEVELQLLKNAPHTLEMLTATGWEFPYSREKAAYPLPFVAENKFWPSVRRVDEAYGDRNLICTCTPIEAYR